MTSRPDAHNRTISLGQARLPALLITTLVVAAVCTAATWPRWHPAAPVVSLVATAPANPGTAQNIGMLPNAASGSLSSASTARANGNGTPVATPLASAAPSSAPSLAPSASSSLNPALAGAANPGSAPGGQAPSSPAATPSPLTANALSDNGPDNPPNWNRLNDAQHTALGPFAAQWDKFSDQQKRKWLAIAAVFPRMSPGAQQRLHARMLRWTQMTPEERTLARENYELSRVLPPNARQQAWLAYEALPPAQKAKLAAAEKLHRRHLVVSALPNAHTDAHARHGAPKNGGHNDPHALTLEPLIPLGTPGAATVGVASSATSTTNSTVPAGAMPNGPTAAATSAATQRDASASVGVGAPHPESAGDSKP